MLSHRSRRAVGVAAVLAALTLPVVSAHAVEVGDVAVIYFAADDPDAIAFVVLREIPGGTALRFTDSGWQTSGSFRATEGGVQYTAAATLSPGTVVSRSSPFSSDGWSVNNSGLGSNNFLLSASGDQVLTFTGDAGSPGFVHAVHFDSTGYGDATTSNTTGLPPGLTVGVSAVNLSETDNGYYDGPTIGSPTELLEAIGNPSNWVTSNSRLNPPGWSFSVTGSSPVIQSVNIAGTDFETGDDASITVILSDAPPAGSPATVELSSGAFAAPQNVVISNPQLSVSVDIQVVNTGVWTVAANAVSGVTGSATSGSFTVGDPIIPPVADAGPDIAVQLVGSVVTVSLDDATGEVFSSTPSPTYTWTPATGTGIVNWQNRTGPLTDMDAPGDASITLDAVGAYTLTLTVTDGNGLMDTDTVVVTVNNTVPGDEYDPPAGYYDAATGQGATLKSQLAAIISSGHSQQSYGEYRYSAGTYDADPEIPGNILLVYSRVSVPGTWDLGSTWNREHVWPQSRQPGDASNSSTGNLGDPHALRPIDPGVNSSRGNKAFGNFDSTGTFGAVTGGFYFPGDFDKGDVTRSLLYSATRYMSTLTLADGDPGGDAMGDLASIVRYHYTDVPDTFERRRSHLIYLDQNNRNPYIDLPEIVWSIWGDGANDSTLYVSPTEPVDGASAVLFSFPPVIVGGPLPSSTPVTLRKAGVDPTYFLVETQGDAIASLGGRYNAFDFNPQERTIDCGLAASTATSGLKAGSVRIDNLDISSEGQGQGTDDGDDSIDLELPVLDHAEASFAPASDVDVLEIDFGRVRQGEPEQVLDYTIHNLSSGNPNFTADLDLVSVTPAGNSDVLLTDAVPFSALAPGGDAPFSATFDSNAPVGQHEATYSFEVSDEDLPGATLGVPLTLTLRVEVYVPIFPFDDDGDNDIDVADWSNFVDCFSGPFGGYLSVDCPNHDANTDGAVDLRDAAAFQEAATGALP